ncbi:dynamin family protein [Herbaspirillum sp. SJZ107]|uniref:dynamin family protein n=1 Tax=Herbaspirillum sp. SJZ107 TaxID=2572881 RepID=UPI00114D7164|nr:dynamin family protein [Herbaspirillum sp. SJZ107]TQK03447.1 dynamin family protein [Herbaspirillum sp. SJZ107]
MNHIEITHNPFIVETQFVINGQPPAEGCKLTSYKESRLQLWIEKLFDELARLFNGDDNFHVTFTGVESDFLDLQAAAEAAVESGMQVAVEWVKTEPADTRLEKMRFLMDEARSHPKFEACISQNREMQKSLGEAFDSDFDVHVVATMSAGKSTLINAMLGRDLLPAANEATTATITRIADDKTISTFRGTRFDKEGDAVAFLEDMDLKTVEEWNRLDDTLLIDIEGDIRAVQKRDNVRLVLTDTPGPNNSQDEEHARVTMSFIQDSKRNPLILYVLNASQLRTNDDKHLLGLVAEAMRKGGKQSKDRFIFVINKMDVFDPEKENLPSTLSRVEKYLTDNGIQNPLIYPISANLARLIRTPSDRHSRNDRREYIRMADLFSEEPSMNLLQYMPITSRVSRAVKGKGCSPLMLSSGLPAVEAMIDEYIDKYNLPHRVQRVYDALSRTIEVGLNEASLVAQLEQGEEELARIDDELQILHARRNKGFDAAAYKDKVEREGKVLPESTEQALVELQRQNDEFIRKVAAAFTGSTTPEVAKHTTSEAEKDLRFHFKSLVNKYESVFEDSQDAIKQDLTAEYRQYVMDLFGGSQNLELPVLEGIRKSVTDIALNLNVEDRDIKTERVKVGMCQVSTSRWYKPWTWGDTEEKGIYENKTYVDLEELWNERQTRIWNEFSKLVKSARKRIDAGKDTLVDKFLAFMDQEFDEKFNALLASIEEKLHDRTAREQALQEAKNQQNWIMTFKSKLDATLAMEPVHDD